MGIIGFNSPEWFIADLAAVFAGGMAAGIYPTNGAEACRHIMANCKANILVVEDAKQLEKFKAFRDELTDLKAAYLDGDGDMNYIMDNVLCAVQEEDEARFAGIIRKWIADGDVPDLKKFSKAR